MKKFTELTEEEKARANALALTKLTNAIVDGSIRFDDDKNEEKLQSRIDAALARAEAKQTPWFAVDYLKDDVFAWATIEGMAITDAEDSLYAEPEEYVVHGIIERKH